MKTFKCAFFLFLLLALTTSAWGTGISMAKQQGDLPETPLYPALSWKNSGLSTRTITLNIKGDALLLHGNAYQATEQFVDDLPQEALEYYSNRQLAQSGWSSHDAYENADGLYRVFYHETGTYLSVELISCMDEPQSTCIIVWESDPNAPSTLVPGNSPETADVNAAGTFTKKLPAKNATGINPLNVTLSWNAYTPTPEKYSYCVKEGEPCENNDPNWTGTFTNTSVTITNLGFNKTYYWQVKALTCSSCTPKTWVFADNNTWWQFTTMSHPAISGNAGIGGAVLAYYDGGAKTVTADASGNYSFTIPYDWSGTVTPSKPNYLFTPVSRSYTSVKTNQTAQNYTATAGYTISGNAGVSGAVLTYVDGVTRTVTANNSGNYSLVVSPGWSGTVTPSREGYTFIPINRSYANVTAHQSGQDYTATIIMYIISGNAALAGVTLSYTDGAPKTVMTDGSGNYSITIPYNWSGTVTPSKLGFAFTPPTRVYGGVKGNQVNQNYTAAWGNWSGSLVVTSSSNVVAVARPHVGAEVMTYNAFGNGATSMFIPMLFKAAFGGSYNAALYIQNADALNTATISIKYYDTNGNLTCSQSGLSIAPSAIQSYWIPSVTCLPNGWVGSAVISADRNIAAIGRAHIGSQVTSYSGFGNGSNKMFVPMLFKAAFGGSYNAALYIQNTSNSNSAAFTIEYYDANGQLTCTTSGESLSPLATRGYWLPSVGCIPNDWTGAAIISSDQNIVAVGRPHIGAQVTTYNGVSEGQTSLRVPMLFKAAFGGSYNAALYVQNTDAATPASIRINYYDASGNLTCFVDDTLAALASKGYWLPSTACLPSGWSGSATITADTNIVAVGRPHIGGEVATYNGFASGSTTLFLPMLFKTAYGGAYNSAFYVQNLDETNAASVTFKFYDSTGYLHCTKTDSIPPKAAVGYWVPSLTCNP